MKRTGTSTSDFGVSKREGHDASRFYGSKMYEGLRVDETCPVIDASASLDPALFGGPLPFTDASLARLPPHSLHLVIVPVAPFTGESAAGIDAYLDHVRDTIARLVPALTTSGRLVLVVDDTVDARVAASGYWPLHAYIATRVLDLGVYMRGEVILARRRAGDGVIARDAGTRPAVRPVYDHGLVFSKGVPGRVKRGKRETVGRTDTITRDEFLEWTKSVWQVDGEDTLPACLARFATLYSFLEDNVLLACHEGQDRLHATLAAIRPRLVVLVMPGGAGP